MGASVFDVDSYCGEKRRYLPFFAADTLAVKDRNYRHATSSTASGPPSPQGEGILAGTLLQNIYFSRRFKVNREAPQKSLRRTTPRYKTTSGWDKRF